MFDNGNSLAQFLNLITCKYALSYEKLFSRGAETVRSRIAFTVPAVIPVFPVPHSRRSEHKTVDVPPCAGSTAQKHGRRDVKKKQVSLANAICYM